MSSFKPHKAVDWKEDKVIFPMCALPKIDGMRALNPHGQILARSLKRFANTHTNETFSGHQFMGYDGELACGIETDSDLCRNTTSALNTILGEPVLTWHIFDLCAESVAHLGYETRYNMAKEYLTGRHAVGELLDLKVVPMVVVNDMHELLEIESTWLEAGYEGVILRHPEKPYKHGTGTVTQADYLRIKRFIEEDAKVIQVIEGQKNMNDEQENELGYTFRSTHQENMIPNGLVGSLLCIDIKTGNEITVSAGSMTHEMRQYYYENPEEIINHIIKYKHFPKGVKDKPRFPTFQSVRADVDVILP